MYTHCYHIHLDKIGVMFDYIDKRIVTKDYTIFFLTKEEVVEFQEFMKEIKLMFS